MLTDFEAQARMYEMIIERDMEEYARAMQNKKISESVIGFQTKTGTYLTCHNGGLSED